MVGELLQIAGRRDADEGEENAEHLLGELRLFFAVRGEDVEIGVETVHVAAEDEDATPGAKDGEKRDIGDVP